MCGDQYSRTPTVDSGDLVAILHPSSTYSSTFFGGRLHLSNRTSGATISTLSCREGSISSASDSSSDSGSTQDSLSVRIHKFGQPLLLSDAVASNPVMHAFPVSGCEMSSAGARLNLGVGGDGVVGRTVSIVDSRRRVLGEGVIGWS